MKIPAQIFEAALKQKWYFRDLTADMISRSASLKTKHLTIKKHERKGMK